MADTNNLPEGTDTIIEGAGAPQSASTGDTSNADVSRPGAAVGAASVSDSEKDLIVSENDRTSGSSAGIRETLRSGGDKIRTEASSRAYGFVGQGLERSSEALTNISSLINDTVEGIEGKLGPQYADYARTAASAIDKAAVNLSKKEPEDLVDDVRELVRKSPAIALTGAAILGFALVRLVRAGNDEGSASRGRRAKSGDA